MTPKKRFAFFSLVEVLIALTIMGLIGGMMTLFLYYSSLSIIYANHYLDIDTSLRYLGEILTRNAGITDYFVLYEDSYHKQDASQRISTGSWGDYLIFVQLGEPAQNPNTQKWERPIQRLYAIARVDGDRSSVTGKIMTDVWQYVVDVLPESGFDPIETLLPSTKLGDNAVKLAHCPAASDTQRMFYKMSNQSLLVDLEIGNNYRHQFQSATFHFIINCPTLL